MVKKIDLRPMKRYAKEGMPEGSELRQLILMEEDDVTPDQLLVIARIWLRLSTIEFGNK